jgi:hypothetical protein
LIGHPYLSLTQTAKNLFAFLIRYKTLAQLLEQSSMKTMFPGHYRPTEKELKELWDKCLFIMDANVLLNIYRYSPNTRKQLFKIFKNISDRLWVPHQAAFEYQTNRLNVIAQQKKAYSDISSALEKFRNQLDGKIGEYRRHPYVDSSHILEQVELVISTITEDLKSREQKHPDLIHEDSIRDTLTSLLDGKIGQPYTADKIRSICKEGEERYKHSIPPGYSDSATKESDKKYGDLILWFQIMDKIKEAKMPVLLITDDTKDDWWWKFNGQVIGPRPELIEELLNETQQFGYLYRSDQFMTYAEQYLKQQVNQLAIDEVRAIRKDDEAKMMIQKLRVEQKYVEAERASLEKQIATTEQTLENVMQELAGVKEEIEKSGEDETNTKKQQELTELAESFFEKLNVLQKRRAMLQMKYKDIRAKSDMLSHQYQSIEDDLYQQSKRK